jgi:hypothetical protein
MRSKELNMYTWCDLTDQLPFPIELEQLRKELEQLKDDSWLEHYDVTLSRGWKSIPLVSRQGEATGPESQRAAPYEEMQRTRLCGELPAFSALLDSFKCPHGRIRITRLDPGAGIDKHRDVGHEVANLAFRKVRLHIPIETNPGVYFWIDGEKMHMDAGRLYYVNFSKLHYVKNDGETPRYHLVMDLGVNDWLIDFFPEYSFPAKIEMATNRLLLPFFWYLRRGKVVWTMKFWEHYNGSWLQKTRHRYFPKN